MPSKMVYKWCAFGKYDATSEILQTKRKGNDCSSFRQLDGNVVMEMFSFFESVYSYVYAGILSILFVIVYKP